jgi:hypothetical protein
MKQIVRAFLIIFCLAAPVTIIFSLIELGEAQAAPKDP